MVWGTWGGRPHSREETWIPKLEEQFQAVASRFTSRSSHRPGVETHTLSSESTLHTRFLHPQGALVLGSRERDVVRFYVRAELRGGVSSLVPSRKGPQGGRVVRGFLLHLCGRVPGEGPSTQ